MFLGHNEKCGEQHKNFQKINDSNFTIVMAWKNGSWIVLWINGSNSTLLGKVSFTISNFFTIFKNFVKLQANWSGSPIHINDLDRKSSGYIFCLYDVRPSFWIILDEHNKEEVTLLCFSPFDHFHQHVQHSILVQSDPDPGLLWIHDFCHRILRCR